MRLIKATVTSPNQVLVAGKRHNARLPKYRLQVTIPVLADHSLVTLTWHIC